MVFEFTEKRETGTVAQITGKITWIEQRIANDQGDEQQIIELFEF